jgi:hypothetical protein
MRPIFGAFSGGHGVPVDARSDRKEKGPANFAGPRWNDSLRPCIFTPLLPHVGASALQQ